MDFQTHMTMNFLFFWEKSQKGIKTFHLPIEEVFTGYVHESRHTLGTQISNIKHDLTHHKKMYVNQVTAV